MHIDLNLTITAIIALIALISPIATAVINNFYQSKRENVKNYELAKRNALSKFIDSAQKTLYAEGTEFLSEYVSNFEKMFIYFSDITVETIKPFDHARAEVSKNDTPENIQKANRELSNIVFTLSKQIKKK